MFCIFRIVCMVCIVCIFRSIHSTFNKVVSEPGKNDEKRIIGRKNAGKNDDKEDNREKKYWQE